MKLLICTQKVDQNDDNLSFFVDWIAEFAKHCEKVSVICLYKGQYNLPENVSVYSLGKENFEFRISNFESILNFRIYKKILYASHFFKYIWKLRNEYDSVFVHMNPEYIVLGGLFWKFWHKKVSLWYTHHSVTLKLRVATKMIDMIFTSVAESFRLKTKTPIYITGHGINTEKFQPKQKPQSDILCILSDTRIARSKHVERSLEISRLLKEAQIKHVINIVGGPILDDDKIFYEELKDEIKREDLPVNLVGPVPFNSLPAYYQAADIFINHANPGGLNKVVLQAMARNLYVLTSNSAYRGILPGDEIVNPEPKEFADKIIGFAKLRPVVNLRDIILQGHDLKNLILKIVDYARTN